MQIHHRRFVSGLHEMRFELVKEDRLIRPGVLSSFFLNQIPLPFELRILGENGFFGRIAQEHFTDNGLNFPPATRFSQINAFKSGVRFMEA